MDSIVDGVLGSKFSQSTSIMPRRNQQWEEEERRQPVEYYDEVDLNDDVERGDQDQYEDGNEYEARQEEEEKTAPKRKQPPPPSVKSSSAPNKKTTFWSTKNMIISVVVSFFLIAAIATGVSLSKKSKADEPLASQQPLTDKPSSSSSRNSTVPQTTTTTSSEQVSPSPNRSPQPPNKPAGSSSDGTPVKQPKATPQPVVPPAQSNEDTMPSMNPSPESDKLSSPSSEQMRPSPNRSPQSPNEPAGSSSDGTPVKQPKATPQPVVPPAQSNVNTRSNCTNPRLYDWVDDEDFANNTWRLHMFNGTASFNEMLNACHRINPNSGSPSEENTFMALINNYENMNSVDKILQKSKQIFPDEPESSEGKKTRKPRFYMWVGVAYYPNYNEIKNRTNWTPNINATSALLNSNNLALCNPSKELKPYNAEGNVTKNFYVIKDFTPTNNDKGCLKLVDSKELSKWFEMDKNGDFLLPFACVSKMNESNRQPPSGKKAILKDKECAEVVSSSGN